MRVYVNAATGEMSSWIFTALAWRKGGMTVLEYKEYPDELILVGEWKA